MAFKNITSRNHEHIRSLASTMKRMHAMTGPFLARNLLGLARRARQEAPRELSDPMKNDYDTNLVWRVIPVLASRLSRITLDLNEGPDPGVTQMDDEGLRRLVGVHMRNSSLRNRIAERARTEHVQSVLALDVLGHDFVNGNPIAMAADRLRDPAPEHDDQGDWLARHMRKISRVRFGHARFSSWQPEFQDFPKSEEEYAALTARIQEGPEPW